MKKQRVVITGIGTVSPAGIGKNDFAESILGGKDLIEEIPLFEPGYVRKLTGSYLKGFEPSKYLKQEQIDGMSKIAAVSVIAAKLAIMDSQLKLNESNGKYVIDSIDPYEIGTILGTGTGGSNDFERMIEEEVKDGWNSIPEKEVQLFRNDISREVSSFFGIRGVNQVIPTACSAGNDAIVMAYDQIVNNRAKVMIAGGVDLLSKPSIVGFLRMNAIAKEYATPFDLNRSGIMLGEGAGMLVLETLEGALERNAPIYAEIIGHGISCDAHHLTSPDSSFNGGPVKALRKAVSSANILPSEVDYICAHGTGTHANDVMETNAIKQVFGEDAYKIPVSSIKSMIGHTAGAAGALGAITCILAMQKEIIPPTIHYSTKDPECDLDYVPNKPRKWKVNVAINNSFAFGGNNTCLVLKKFSATSI